MSARLDAIGNVVGRYEGAVPGAPCLMLGSHLDTVRNAGKYDGMLGVVAAIDCVHALNARGTRLPFAIEVVGFADEEGVRFGSTLLGSRAIAGTFDPRLLDSRDGGGTSMRDALTAFGLDPERSGNAARRRADVLAYAELHIEQGPVLEAEGIPVGVVTAINGANRFTVDIEGFAGHAGTVPMDLRRDALAAAAECVLAIESRCAREPELVGTVGRLEAAPGATNVIPGHVRFTIDLRAPQDDRRAQRGGRHRDGHQRRSARAATSRSTSARRTRARPPPARPGCRIRSAGRSQPKGCRCAGCPRARATTAWRSSTSSTSACSSSAAKAASATIRSKRSRSTTRSCRRGCSCASSSNSNLLLRPSRCQQPPARAIEDYLARQRDNQTRFLAELVKVPSDNPPGDCAAHARARRRAARTARASRSSGIRCLPTSSARTA